MISSDQIDIAIDNFSSNIYVEKTLEDLNQTQPPLYAALFSDDSEILNLQERNYYCFLISVTWHIIKPFSTNRITPGTIEEKVEQNWESLERYQDQIIKLIEAIYDDYAEPKMLDFLDDMLQAESSEIEISQAGSRYLFVMMKSMIDSALT